MRGPSAAGATSWHADEDYRMARPFMTRAAAGRGRAPARHPADTSLFTFRGHEVARTLLRARFSPRGTGHRYIYAGCASGRVSNALAQSGEGGMLTRRPTPR